MSAAKKARSSERVKQGTIRGHFSKTQQHPAHSTSVQTPGRIPVGPHVWYIAAVSTGLILIAATVRWISYVNIPLWLDEAWRANIILGASSLHDLIAPRAVQPLPGYVALVRFFSLFHANELVLRLSSLLSGALTPVALFGACFIFTRNIALSLLAGLLSVFNSDLVAYAHEMKPYAFEAFLQSCFWLLLFLWLQDKEHVGKFSVFFAFVVFLLLSTPTVLFLLPATCLALFLAAYRQDSWRGRVRYGAALCGILLLTVAVYVLFFAPSAGDSGLYQYWGDNFYSGEKGSRTAWIFRTLSDQFAQAYATPANSMLANWLPGITLITVLTFPALLYIGFAGEKKNREMMLYVCSPVLALLAANAVKAWPLGAIRVNIFLIPLIILIVVLSLHQLVSKLPRFRDGLGVVVCIVLCANLLPANAEHYRSMNPPLEDIPTVMVRASRAMAANPVLQEYPILVNKLASHSFRFYTQYRERRQDYFHQALLENPPLPIAEAYSDPLEARNQIAASLEGKKGAHFFVSHLSPEEIGKLKEAIQAAGWTIVLEQNDGTAEWLVLGPAASHGRRHR